MLSDTPARFLRFFCSYYVNNEYDEPELNDQPPAVHQIERINRVILADKPRVTKLQINWGDNPEKVPDYNGDLSDGMNTDEDGMDGGGVDNANVMVEDDMQ